MKSDTWSYLDVGDKSNWILLVTITMTAQFSGKIRDLDKNSLIEHDKIVSAWVSKQQECFSKLEHFSDVRLEIL